MNRNKLLTLIGLLTLNVLGMNAQNCNNDVTPPIAICDEVIIISFNKNDTISLWADNIDDGSYDECSQPTLAISNFADPIPTVIPTSEYIRITQEDFENGCLHLVLWVTDASGNTSSCITRIMHDNQPCILPEPIYCHDIYTVEVDEQETIQISIDELLDNIKDESATLTIDYPDGTDQALFPDKVNASLAGITLAYSITSSSGSSCWGQIHVINKNLCSQLPEPVAVCHETFKVSSNGLVLAKHLDAGSHSNCGPVSLTVRKSDEIDVTPPENPFVRLKQEDFENGSVDITLWVEDLQGNFSRCITKVVQDDSWTDSDILCYSRVIITLEEPFSEVSLNDLIVDQGQDLTGYSFHIEYPDWINSDLLPNKLDQTVLDIPLQFSVTDNMGEKCYGYILTESKTIEQATLIFNDGVEVNFDGENIIGDQVTDYCNGPTICNEENTTICNQWLELDKYDGLGIDPSILTEPIWSDCDSYTIDLISETEQPSNQCHLSIIIKTWRIIDTCGNDTIVNKVLKKLPRSDFKVLFPADLQLDFAEYSLNDDYGQPIVSDDDVELIGYSYEDQLFDTEDQLLTLRTWVLIDWCSFDPNNFGNSAEVILDFYDREDLCDFKYLSDGGDGYMTYVQKIVHKKAALTSAEITRFKESDLPCEGKIISAILDAEEGMKKQFTYKWMTETGIPIKESANDFLKVKESGMYHLEVKMQDKTVAEKSLRVNVSNANCKEDIGQILFAYPNPSRGKFSLDSQEKSGLSGNVAIRNIQNQLVLEIKNYVLGQDINLDKIPAGSYFTFFENSRHYGVTKFIKID